DDSLEEETISDPGDRDFTRKVIEHRREDSDN
ncbi:hypothetical protein RRG08_062157, partial [Elysia crispata]